MAIEAGQIYFLRKGVHVGKVDYARPCLVLRASAHDATVCYLSTKIEYLDPGGVVIYDFDPDFKASGLRTTSCILGDLTDEVNPDVFKGAKLLGRAAGEFKKEIEKWYGEPLA